MKSAMVTDVSMQALMTVQGQGKNSAENLPNFADFMQSDSKPSGGAIASMPAKNLAGDAQTAYQKSDRKAADCITKNVNQTRPVKETDAAEVTEKVEEAGKDIIRDIAEELGVSEEDVEAAMELLGLTVEGLIQQGNMAQLIAQITGTQPVEILTDEDLFAQMESLTGSAVQSLNEAAEELGMSVEELTAAIEEAVLEETADGMVEIPDNAAVIADDNAFEAADTAPVVEIVNDTVIASGETEKNVQTEDTVITSDAENGVEAPVSVQETAKQSESAMMREKQDSDGNSKKGHDAAQADNTGMAPTVSNVQNVMQEQVQTENVYERYSAQQTQSIIDQIADYVKINHSQQLTEMELQLNPASLGSIHLQIASKAGTISAQLIAQDQAVAAALEGHLVQLKESLEAQGMKVDAVEVTVASHEFEQNLDNQGRQQEEEAQRTFGRNHRRMLDLNEFSEDEELMEEELSDADRLQIEMMRMGGNRLNFQV